MPPYLNFHTHHPSPEGEATLPAFGLHPWHLTEDWPAQLKTLTCHLSPQSPNNFQFSILNSQIPPLIGECGLDRLCATPYPLQLAAFEAQIRLSERLHRPLILHCVKALDDVLRLHKGTIRPWTWHGFRGKPQQMQQLLAHGFYLSFGFHFNADSLRTCPAERLFFETDDDPRPIADLYATAATLRSTTPEALNQQCWDNAQFIMHHS